MGGARVRSRHCKQQHGGQLLAVLLFAALVLNGCGGGSGGGRGGGGGGGGGSGNSNNVTIVGTAQKGLFQILDVQAYPVTASNGTLGTAVTVPVSGQSFSVDVATTQLTLFEASGTFSSEISGDPITADKPLMAIIAPGTANRTANINIATTLVAELVLRDLRNGGGNAATLIAQHSSFINSVFGFPAGTDPTQLDFNKIAATSDILDANLQLLIISGGIVQMLDGDQLYAGGFQSIVDGILAATNVEEAIAVLSAMNGLSAETIYALAQQYSGFNLPTLVLGNTFYVWICDAASSCQWLEVTEPMVSVANASAWESDGKARVFIRVNRVSSAAMTIELELASDSATSGDDFVGQHRAVTVPAGQSSVFVDVDLIIDAIAESTERLQVTIAPGIDSYPVFQGTANVAIYDGVKPTLDTPDSRDAAGLALSISVDSVCNPVVNMGPANCLSLDGTQPLLGVVDGRTSVAKTQVDVVGDCTALGKCRVSWIVDFFLVAKDGVAAAGEVPLGAFVYPPNKVHLAGSTISLPMPLVRLTDDGSLALMNEAGTNGWDLELEARIGTTNTVSAANPLPTVMTVPDTVLVGDVLLEIGVVNDVMPGADYGCASGQYAINAQYAQPGAPSILGSGTLCVNFAAGGAGAGPAVMVEGRLDVFGGTADAGMSTTLFLPPGLYGQTTITVPGAGEVVDTAPALPLYPAGSSAAISSLLHSNGWPFLFHVNALSLTPDGIEIGYDGMHYVMDAGYSSQDPRSLGILYSNDIIYRGVDGQSGSLILGANGVSGAIAVEGGPGHADHTAFPRARIEWQDFNQAIVDNVLQPAAITIDEFRMSQSAACSGPDCVQGRKDDFVVAGSAALDGKGYLVGDVVNTGAHSEPRWGARANGGYAWSRPDDLTVQTELKLALPGYIVPGQAVSDVLIGHLNESPVAGDAEIYPRGSNAFVDGNYHPTGLSIGPETYRNGSGIPETGDGQDLPGLPLRLDNGQEPAFDLRSSAAVKYVIRNGGITGVFNVESGSLVGAAPQFYGYNFDLTRFAVRTVDNVLDTFNWIDGHVVLNGDAGGSAGLDVWFTNLEIDCSAKLGNIDLLYEACDTQDNNGNGVADENCSSELYAWNAKTDIFAAGFTGNETGDACIVGPQQFGMQQQIHFAALNKPVVFETVWNKDGDMTGQTSGQLPNYRFDRSDEGKGFPMKASSAALDDVQLGVADIDNDRYGWLEMKQSTVGVPFWNSLDTDMRIANIRRGIDIAAEPTVVLKQGELAGLNAAQRNRAVLLEGNANTNAALKAQYEWGRTGFGFKLPVYYQPWQLDNGRSDEDAAGRQSRFLGRQLTKDLFVLDANAGINFIEPERTKLSFGASADFTRLEGLEFQIDITDAGSAAAVDSVLQKLRITNRPLFEPALTDLLTTINVVNRFANRGLDELMQESLEAAVKELGEAAAPLTPNNQDPFVTASEVLTQLQSMPQQMIALIEEDVQRPLNNRLALLEDDMRTALLEAEAAVLAIQGTEPLVDRLPKIEALRVAKEKVRDVLEQLEAAVHVVDAQLAANLRLADDLVGAAQTATLDLSTALQNVNSVMRQATAIADAACSNGLVVTETGAGFLVVAAQRIAAVRRVVDIIQNTNAWLDAAAAIVNSADGTRRLNQAKQRIRDATEELVAFVDNADQAVSELLCHPDELDAVVQQAEAFTQRIIAELAAAQDPFAAARAALATASTIEATFAARVYEPIRTLRAALEPSDNSPSTMPGEILNRSISCVLYKASHDGDCALALSIPVPDADEPYGINALARNEVGERDIADALFYALGTEINGQIEVAKVRLRQVTEGLVPGAYMSPEQLRRLMVTEIMRSEPVKRLRVAMDKHFGEIAYAINNISLQFVDQVNAAVEEALASVTGPINDALSGATSAVRGIPLQSAGMNGFATIAGNELERAHISAGWTMRGSDDDDSTGFKAALDAESWSAKHTNPDANTPTACALDPGQSLLDVTISAYGLPINVLAADINIEKLYLGFTLENNTGSGPALKPVGIFGGINTIGEIGFSEAIVFDPAFAAGLGAKQTYIGASAGAMFSSLTADVAFLVGRVCPGNSVLTDLDPSVDKFLPNLPASGFTGAYLRGGATIPIIPGGCVLNVGVVADFGTWIFVGRPTTLGGLVGGGATGQVACIASLKGKVTVGGSVSTDGDLKLAGEGWGVAGVGMCEPGTWTDVPRSRDDSWCGTGDAQFGASFENGKWKVNPPKPSAIH